MYSSPDSIQPNMSQRRRQVIMGSPQTGGWSVIRACPETEKEKRIEEISHDDDDDELVHGVHVRSVCRRSYPCL